MKKRIKRDFGLMLLISLLTVVSCVNEKYDFGKDIDTEMTFLKNLAVPVGDVGMLTLDEILLSDEEESVISVDNDGNYYLSFDGERIDAQIDVPEVNVSDIATAATTVKFSTGAFADLSVGNLPDQIIDYKTLYNKELSFDMDVELNEHLPSQIKDVKKITFDESAEDIELRFTSGGGILYVEKGFRIVFPEIFVLKSLQNSDFQIESSNVLVCTKDAVISDTPLSVSFAISELDIPSGKITDSNGVTTLSYIDNIHYDGNIYIKTSDYSVIPANVSFDVNIVIAGLSVTSVTALIDPDASFEDAVFGFGEVPEFLKGNNVCIDLYNPSIEIEVLNHTPIAFDVQADITAYQSVGSETVHLGPFAVAAEADEYFNIMRRAPETDAALPDENIHNVVVPEIADLIKVIPEELGISNISVNTAEDYVTIYADQNYGASINYGISSLLAFGEDLSLEFTQKIENIGLELEYEVKSAKITMDIENSIPVDFAISAVALDDAGNVMSDVTLSMDKAIAAGTHSSPTVTSVTIILNNKADYLNVAALDLTMSAKAGASEYAGVPLNKNQGFKINDIALVLPDGVTLGSDN